MPQKVLKFAGINRAVNEFQGAGACEELINLRPMAGGGHRVIKNKNVVEQDVNYDKFFEHTWGEHYNQLAVINGIVVWINSKEGTVQITDEFEGSDVSISAARNILVVYNKEEQKIFRFADNAYESYDLSLPKIISTSLSYEYTEHPFPATAYGVAEFDDKNADYAGSSRQANVAMQNAANAFYAKHPNGLCGASIIGCTYELEDGTEIWSTAFMVADISRYKNFAKPQLEGNTIGIIGVRVYGASDVSFSAIYADDEFVNFKKINVYATRPVLKHKFRVDEEGWHTDDVQLSSLELSGQLMYYVGSLENGATSIQLDFGKAQAGEEVMEVTAGCITRIGEVQSFNNRFYYYKSKKYHAIQIPTSSSSYNITNNNSSVYNPSWDYPTWVAYVKFKNGWRLIDGRYSISQTGPCDFIYPMDGVEKLAFVKGAYDDIGSSFSVPYEEMFYVELKNSTAYNYSYAFDVKPKLESAESFYDEMVEAGQVWSSTFEYSSQILMEDESNSINVSAAFNPSAFPVDYSYSFGGEIIDIVTSYVPISSTMVSRYPITVFTTNGIFALEQGNGTTLYSGTTPLNPYILEGKALATPVGAFFISSKNLYLLAGQDVLCVSSVLHGDIDKDLRKLPAYNALCFDLQPMISNENFEEYLTSANLFYDTFQNELWICSSKPDIKYSYVFNIATKMFHKAHKKISSEQISSRYAIEHDYIYNNISLIDTYDESTSYQQHILLQSRPMPLDVLFSHIQRLILYTDTKLEGDRKLCLSVFASDDLYDWKCIISSQKKDTVLRHIRTNRAAKSYRDYVFIISGTVFTDTDISDLIADYTTVSRRLG